MVVKSIGFFNCWFLRFVLTSPSPGCEPPPSSGKRVCLRCSQCKETFTGAWDLMFHAQVLFFIDLACRFHFLHFHSNHVKYNSHFHQDFMFHTQVLVLIDLACCFHFLHFHSNHVKYNSHFHQDFIFHAQVLFLIDLACRFHFHSNHVKYHSYFHWGLGSYVSHPVLISNVNFT